MNFAHVKWFSEGPLPNAPRLDLLEGVFVGTVVLAGLVTLFYIDRVLRKRKITSRLDTQLRKFRQFVPLIVRVSTAALLLINVRDSYLLAPNIISDGSVLADILTLALAITAVLLILGLFTKQSSLVLLCIYLLVMLKVPIVDVLDHLEYVGVALYFYFRGPGAYSCDALLANKKLETPANSQLALPMYRIFVGAGIAILAISEKLGNIALSQEFLTQHSWNLLAYFGGSDRLFIIVAGSIELLIGIGLILNLAPRLLLLAIFLLMVLTASILGIQEIYGHLFAIGIFVAIWVNDTRPLKYDKL